MKPTKIVSEIIPKHTWSGFRLLMVEAIDSLELRRGDRVLVLGCADGDIGKIIADKGYNITGVDTNVSVLEKARENGIDARLMSGEDLVFKEEFNAVVSFSALHWMRHPDKVITGVWDSLKTGGSFVGITGAYGNLQTVITAFLDVLKTYGVDGLYLVPWYFPDKIECQKRLEKRGFEISELSEIVCGCPSVVPIERWVAGKVGESFASVLHSNERRNFYSEVAELLKSRLDVADGRFVLDYRILKFRAIKP